MTIGDQPLIFQAEDRTRPFREKTEPRHLRCPATLRKENLQPHNNNLGKESHKQRQHRLGEIGCGDRLWKSLFVSFTDQRADYIECEKGKTWDLRLKENHRKAEEKRKAARWLHLEDSLGLRERGIRP